MKTADQVKPNFGPIYAAAIYPDLARIFVDHGYALAVHGSIARDFDLVAIPWIDSPATHETILATIKSQFAVDFVGSMETKKHGRMVYTLAFGFGHCAVDLSFMPLQVLHPESPNVN